MAGENTNAGLCKITIPTQNVALSKKKNGNFRTISKGVIMPDLPDDVTQEILQRLPAISLDDYELKKRTRKSQDILNLQYVLKFRARKTELGRKRSPIRRLKTFKTLGNNEFSSLRNPKPNLPYDITKQILLKLPARSLLRCSLVCKQWRSLISDPKFVKDHTNHALLDPSNRHRRLITYLKSSIEGKSWRLSITSQSIDFQSLNSLNSEFKFETHISSTPRILGSCNGLLLIDGCVILNPLLSRKHKVLPPCDVTFHDQTLLHGLGYASSVDDYKVVRLNWNVNSEAYSVQVYSLKTNSWKTNPCETYLGKFSEFFMLSIMPSKAGTYLQGSIYWAADDSDYIAIIAFDVITENFRLVKLPPSDDEDIGYCRTLEVVLVRGHLGAYRPGLNRDEIVIWIWNEVENREGYWTKLLKIPRKYRALTKVLSLMNSNEVLLRVCEDCSEKLVVYDTVGKMFRDLPCGRLDRQIHHTVETLILPITVNSGLS